MKLVLFPWNAQTGMMLDLFESPVEKTFGLQDVVIDHNWGVMGANCVAYCLTSGYINIVLLILRAIFKNS